METKEWKDLNDRSGWPSGEWDNEPDKMQWPDEATGLPCLIVRNRSGALCGYVGVPNGHPWYDVYYGDIEPYPDVHGGLTFTDKCHPRPEGDPGGICHIVDQGEPDDVWWLGFDCLHYRDTSPGTLAYAARYGDHTDPDETYKNVSYVQGEIRGLARQAAAVAS